MTVKHAGNTPPPLPDGLTIRPAKPEDGAAIQAIDTAGLATGHASFRREPYGWDAWSAVYASGTALGLVTERRGVVLGWAGVAGVSDRCAYAGVGEVSIYIAEDARGGGLGRRLLGALISASETAGYWTLVAQCFPENAGSLQLHARCGFRRVGVRAGLGRMSYGPLAGSWRDVVMLERRSTVVGC